MRWALILAIFISGCEYSGHTLKAQVGREIGETVKGTEYTVGCEIRFDKRR